MVWWAKSCIRSNSLPLFNSRSVTADGVLLNLYAHFLCLEFSMSRARQVKLLRFVAIVQEIFSKRLIMQPNSGRATYSKTREGDLPFWLSLSLDALVVSKFCSLCLIKLKQRHTMGRVRLKKLRLDGCCCAGEKAGRAARLAYHSEVSPRAT